MDTVCSTDGLNEKFMSIFSRKKWRGRGYFRNPGVCRRIILTPNIKEMECDCIYCINLTRSGWILWTSKMNLYRWQWGISWLDELGSQEIPRNWLASNFTCHLIIIIMRSGGRSVGIVRSRTQTMEFSLMALQPMFGLGRLFHFLDPIHSRYGSLDGDQPDARPLLRAGQ
jgi:hypothetical protein